MEIIYIHTHTHNCHMGKQSSLKWGKNLGKADFHKSTSLYTLKGLDADKQSTFLRQILTV